MNHTPSFVFAVRPSCAGVVLCALAWAFSGATSSHAAQPATSNMTGTSTTAPEGASLSYTTKAGDTLNKIVHSQFKDSPLHTQVLVKAVRQLNPDGLPAKADQRLKTGLTLKLPAHHALLREILQAHLPEGTTAPKGPTLGQEHWVRFP